MPTKKVRGFSEGELEAYTMGSLAEDRAQQIESHDESHFLLNLKINNIRKRLGLSMQQSGMFTGEVRMENHLSAAQEIWEKISTGKTVRSADEEIVLMDARLRAAGKTRADIGLTDEMVAMARSNFHFEKARDQAEAIKNGNSHFDLDDLRNHLLVTGKDLADVGLTEDLIKEKLAERSLNWARRAWDEANGGEPTIAAYVSIMEMDAALAKAGKTRADIEVTDEMVRDAYLAEAEQQWEYMRLRPDIETLEEMDVLLEAASKTREDIDVTDEELERVCLEGARDKWQAFLRDADQYSMPEKLLEDMDDLLVEAGQTRTDIGVTEQMIDQVFARLNKKN